MDLTALRASATAKMPGRAKLLGYGFDKCLNHAPSLIRARVASPLLASGVLQDDMREG